jgi:hypothetical protein
LTKRCMLFVGCHSFGGNSRRLTGFRKRIEKSIEEIEEKSEKKKMEVGQEQRTDLPVC